MYCLAIHCSIVAIMNKSQQDGLVGPPAERSTEGKEKKNERRSRRYKVGLDQIVKTSQKLIKKSRNWLINDHILSWNSLNMKCMQWPETEIKSIFSNLDRKIREITASVYFWRVLAVENHCAPWPPQKKTWKCWNSTQFAPPSVKKRN